MGTKASDVMDKVTAAIIASIEEGLVDGTWKRPWTSNGVDGLGIPTNASTGKPYRGGNIFVLWLSSLESGYTSSKWATYKQWEAMGAQVRKGERGTFGVKYTPLECRNHSKDEQCQRCGSVAVNSFALFNADQVDGYESTEEVTVERQTNPDGRVPALDAFFDSVGATIEYGRGSACYMPAADRIGMPSFEDFVDADSFYAVLSHELVHWTGAESRLGRDLSGRFGSNSYAMEELVAELGSAMMCATLGITDTPRPDHAQYLKHWLEVLKEDSKALWSAASLASKAVAFLGADTFTPAPEVVPA